MINSTKLRSVWHRWSGSAQEFPLDTRIFHSVCLISILALVYNIPLNYLVGLPMIAEASVLTLFLVASVYYLSRVRGKARLAKLTFCAVAMTLFVVNFFLNSGIDGPTDLFFILIMIMTVSVVSVRQYWFWVILNLCVVLGLHYLHYLRPDWIPDTYEKAEDRFIDISSAYVTVVAVVLYNFYYIRRSYEAEKRSAEENARVMNTLNEEKNKLISIISHDLKSPLSNVQNYLEVLTEVNISEEERLVIENELLSATRSTIELLNNLMNWTKSQMVGLTFKLSRLNLCNILSPQLLLSLNIANNKRIKMEFSIDPNIEVFGNADMLQLVVRNIVNNAIKFTNPGGVINLTATANSQECTISVKDSGNGQPVVLGQEIFFLNSPPSTGTANEKGIGLGLVLCKEYAEAQNGTISFKCDSISGMTFYVTLPTIRDQAKQAHKEQQS